MVVAGLGLMTLALTPIPSEGQAEPIQLSLVGPTIQLVDDDADIIGVRLSLFYGLNRNVTGLDIGLVSHTRGDSKGVQFGFLGLTDGTFTGWQDNFVNIARERFQGLQHGAVNVMGTGEGVQWSWAFNRAEYLNGLQFSLVNFAEDMDGVQVGLVNIIRSKRRFPVLPIVNWKFE
jgi:hypothetical protein